MVEIAKLLVCAGNHARHGCPAEVFIPQAAMGASAVNAKGFFLREACGQTLPVQLSARAGGYWLRWIVNGLPAGTARRYTLLSGQAAVCGDGVTLTHTPQGQDIHIGGAYFASYVHDPTYAKPFLGPILGEGGHAFTRLDFQTAEHPHHRSLWMALGDVNGVDFWNEPEGAHGLQRHQGFDRLVSGDVYGLLEAKTLWTDHGSAPLLEDLRRLVIYNTPASARLLDITLTLRAAFGPVALGGTKEAGPLGIRVAESMKVANGGAIENAYGALGEAECWGRIAHWCDYSGQVGGHELGIAVYDHPENPDYPTHWHVRNYGLLAPNNLYFRGGRLLKPEDALTWRYRVYFHSGDAVQAEVSERYHDYISPPAVTLEAVQG